MALTIEEETILQKQIEVTKAYDRFVQANTSYQNEFSTEVAKIRTILDAQHKPNIEALKATHANLDSELKALLEA